MIAHEKVIRESNTQLEFDCAPVVGRSYVSSF